MKLVVLSSLFATVTCLACTSTPQQQETEHTVERGSRDASMSLVDAEMTLESNMSPPTVDPPDEHRALPQDCGAAPTGWSKQPVPSPNRGTLCSGVTDCGPGVHCVNDPRVRVRACISDECYSDSDCDEGSACLCGNIEAVHRCVPAECRTDQQCAESGYCSPSPGCFGKTSGTIAYYCRTARDECRSDRECKAGGFCGYDVNQTFWRCLEPTCFGGIN